MNSRGASFPSICYTSFKNLRMFKIFSMQKLIQKTNSFEIALDGHDLEATLVTDSATYSLGPKYVLENTWQHIAVDYYSNFSSAFK